MNTRTKLIHTAIAMTVIGLVGTTVNAAVLIDEDFSGSSGSTPPSGWSFVAMPGSSPTPTYDTGGGYDGSASGGKIVANSWNNTHDALPGGYIVNSGSAAFDATLEITGSFGFLTDNTGFYASSSFIMGDVKTSFSGSDAGQLVSAALTTATFSPQAAIVDGSATKLAGTVDLSADTWYQADFSWTPTTGSTGNFSYTVKNTSGTTVGSLATSAPITLDSQDVYFGFGAGQPGTYGPAGASFDNINITQIPEPGSLALLGLGGLLIARRRRRK